MDVHIHVLGCILSIYIYIYVFQVLIFKGTLYYLFQQKMTQAELQALKRGRVYQCLDCEPPRVPYVGERRQVVAHLYKYHVPLDQVPFYCTLCHFLTSEKDKLEAHVKHYTKHVDAVRALEKSGNPPENFLRSNSNPMHHAPYGRSSSHKTE
jgi:hypothetical protein